jgi:hypothetical protein
MKQYKIVTFVPAKDGDKIREAMGKAGAGKIGNYTFCTFTTPGTGRFTPGEGAHPAIGEVGKPEKVEEEKIETVCSEEFLKQTIKAIRAAHPYDEPAIDVYPIEVIE